MGVILPDSVRRRGGKQSENRGLRLNFSHESQHYHPEFEHCLFCGQKLKSRRYLNWRKPIQMLSGNVFVTSRGRYCSCRPELTYLSAEAAHLSLPHSTYGLDVLVRIGYLRDYEQKTYAQVHADLPSHIRISERHVSNLYRDYLALPPGRSGRGPRCRESGSAR